MSTKKPDITIYLRQDVKDQIPALLKFYEAPSVSRLLEAMIEDYIQVMNASQNVDMNIDISKAIENKEESNVDKYARMLERYKDQPEHPSTTLVGQVEKAFL